MLSVKCCSWKISKDIGEGKDGGMIGLEELGVKVCGCGWKFSVKVKGDRVVILEEGSLIDEVFSIFLVLELSSILGFKKSFLEFVDK